MIGTNIHESRRSENQLKGRAARQGDPGETIMLFDLEDAMMTETFSASSKMFRGRFCCCLLCGMVSLLCCVPFTHVVLCCVPF